jgi:hypothetical protein
MGSVLRCGAVVLEEGLALPWAQPREPRGLKLSQAVADAEYRSVYHLPPSHREVWTLRLG